MIRVIMVCRATEFKQCLTHSKSLGEVPITGHTVGLVWMEHAQRCVVYDDNGISAAMKKIIARAEHFNVPIVYRKLNTDHQ